MAPGSSRVSAENSAGAAVPASRQLRGRAVDWDLYRFFVAAAEVGSLSGAAERLGVSEPTVGRRITELEGMLGCSLFLRSTRGLVLTQAGRHICERASDIETSIAELHRLALGVSEIGTSVVRLSTSEGIGQYWVCGLLPGFLEANPGARVELIISNQSIDLGHNEADVALRLGSPGHDSLYAMRVASVEFGLYASREYVRVHGIPTNDADLESHRFIGWSGKLARFEPAVWLNDIVPHECMAISSDSLAFGYLAAENGLGIALLACLLGKNSANLVRVPITVKLPVLPLWLVTHEGTRKLPGVRALVQYIRTQAHQKAADFVGTSQE
ncbi:LysR family transcriptional regulator [Cupriavidus oxalaticus]|uniref:LysR family transcriptional regulator n=1 Tax=Cupriavidus oxalaticus TaxID=96344 RepID=UPI003172B0B0